MTSRFVATCCASVPLHMRISNSGKRSDQLSGYGRGAALTTRPDAARLILANIGATFARDSYEVLGRFQNLRPTTNLQIGKTLEEVLAHRIEQYPIKRNDLSTLKRDPEYEKLPQIAFGPATFTKMPFHPKRSCVCTTR